MIITINVPDQDIQVLRRFASLSRTLDNARYVAREVKDFSTNTVLEDRINILTDDLDTIQVPIDRLHKVVQTELNYPSAVMQKWEYNTIELSEYYVAETDDNMDHILDQFGSDGWELVGVYKDKWWLFKRPTNN